MDVLDDECGGWVGGWIGSGADGVVWGGQTSSGVRRCKARKPMCLEAAIAKTPRFALPAREASSSSIPVRDARNTVSLDIAVETALLPIVRATVAVASPPSIFSSKRLPELRCRGAVGGRGLALAYRARAPAWERVRLDPHIASLGICWFEFALLTQTLLDSCTRSITRMPMRASQAGSSSSFNDADIPARGLR
ncbi:uncharacterized protein PAN0_008d3530 [Moesziomyces antarcticus]|uniref:Uncharacterized protein n=1 Tax=Pseudozyma antarctica TaxID=84753 RepID=A0A081CF67_PSEA2|nr:uncharacterized protein PAN0_008d3530 [Moesziomyces antarcticus]GAK65313.1 hypothetical protein PAN0_008d3530 [Moesziomyces antarcticus]